MRRWDKSHTSKEPILARLRTELGDRFSGGDRFVHVATRAGGGLTRFRAGHAKASGRDLKALFDQAVYH